MNDLVPPQKVCTICGLVANDKRTVSLPSVPVCDSCDAIQSATCDAVFKGLAYYCSDDHKFADDVAKIYQRTITPALNTFAQERAILIRGLVLANREVARLAEKHAAALRAAGAEGEGARV